MRRAGQTPHGARPNREGFPGKPSGFAGGPRRVGAPQPPGRSLEPRSNAWPRGMIVLPATADRIRLTGPAATKYFNPQRAVRAVAVPFDFPPRSYQIIFAPTWMWREPPEPMTGFEAATSGVN